MYDQFLPLLQEQGMSEKEALIYLVTLELGSAPASSIARKTGIKRVTTYAILRDLERQQIAHAIEKWGITYFQVIEPTRLLAKMKQQYETFAEKLPELMALVQSYTTKPRVQYFEWVSGVKEMYEDLLTSKESMHSFLWTASSDPQFLTYLYEEFLPRRVASNIKAYVLIPADEHSKQYARLDKKTLTETRIVSDPMFQLSTEIILYGPGKVAIALFTSEEMSGIVMQSQKLYESMLNIFTVLRNVTDDK
jgi:sugar-specific transcriptional regulator TrmB